MAKMITILLIALLLFNAVSNVVMTIKVNNLVNELQPKPVEVIDLPELECLEV